MYKKTAFNKFDVTQIGDESLRAYILRLMKDALEVPSYAPEIKTIALPRDSGRGFLPFYGKKVALGL